MEKQRLTGKQIAQMTGVSPTTVSLVRKGRRGVGAEKRAQILKLLQQEGYTNLAPANLQENTVALLYRDDLYDLKQAFYNEVINAILRLNCDYSYNFIIKSINFEDIGETESAFTGSDFWNACIVCGDPNDIILQHLFQNQIPFVVIDSSAKSQLSGSVCVDYEDAAYRMTKYLIENGHRRIAFISNSGVTVSHGFTVNSFSGFRRAFEEAELPITPNEIRLDVRNEDQLYAFLDYLMQEDDPPTALFCSTDNNAILSMRYLWKKGFSIPEQLSIVGMDDITISKYTTPALTTMRVDCEEMAEKSIELLSSVLKDHVPRSVYLEPCKLIVRESVHSL